MRTLKGIDSILRRIMETGGMTEDMEKDVQSLRDELNEREGILRKYGEEWDGEAEEFNWSPKPFDDYRSRYEEMQGKYRDLVERYNARFFAPGDAHDDEIVFEDRSEEIPSEENIKISDLFKED